MSQNKKGNKYVLSVLFLILIMAVTVYLLLKDNDLDEMLNILLSTNWKYVAIGAGLMVIFFYFEGASLRVIVNSLGNKITQRRSFVYSCINEFYSFITPFGSGGQPFTIYYMMHDGISGPNVSITTLVSLLCYKIVMIVYSVVLAVFKPELVFGNGAFVIILFALSAVINIGMILLILFSMYNKTLVRNLGGWCFRTLTKIGILKKERLEDRINHFNTLVDDYRTGVLHLKHHKSIFVKSFLYCFIQRTAIFAVAFMAYLGLGYGGEMWFDVIAAQALIFIAVDSLPLPGGVGITESLFMTIYSSIYGEASTITMAVLLTRAINYLFALLFSGTISFIKQIKVVRGAQKNA